MEKNYFSKKYLSADGSPCPPGMVLAPFPIDPEGDTTWKDPNITHIYRHRYGEELTISFICFPVMEEKFDLAMQSYYAESNRILEPYRNGRCVVNEKKEHGRDRFYCPKTNRCENCEKKRIDSL